MNQTFGSGWGSLLWKEWRQQRAAALLLGLFCLLGYVGFCWFYHWEPEGSVLLVILALLALCIGTSSFTAEADDRTATFIGQLPLPPWQILAAKYLMATGLVFLCMAPIILVFRVLVAANASYRWHWLMFSRVTVFLLATSIVAVTGAIARQGLRGMATLLASGTLCAAALLLLGPARHRFWSVCEIVLRERDFFLAFWCVAHLWLLRVWVWKAPSRPAWRETIAWATLFLLVPLGPSTALFFYQRPRPTPPSSPQQSRTEAAVSPNGQAIALVHTIPGSPSTGALDISPLDIGVGTAQHPRIRSQRYQPGSSPRSQLHWSPDGKRIVAYENPARERYPVFHTDGKTAAEQWVVDVRSGSVGKGHSPPDALVISWLKNGTKAVCTPTAWEFTDDATGKVQRCLHPTARDPVGRQFRDARSSQCDDGIYACAMERSGGAAMCHVWRSAPGIPRAERRDFGLKLDLSGMPENLLPVRMSPDAQWLLFTLFSSQRHPYWLLSLADGTCHRLEHAGEHPLSIPVFTPDSELLLVCRDNVLQVLELPGLRWREAASLPVEGRYGRGPGIVSSAERPHCLAVTGGQREGTVVLDPGRHTVSQPEATFVLDLDRHTSVQVFPEAGSPSKGENSHRVLWFDGERLVLEKASPYQIWAVNADGTNCRQVLP